MRTVAVLLAACLAVPACQRRPEDRIRGAQSAERAAASPGGAADPGRASGNRRPSADPAARMAAGDPVPANEAHASSRAPEFREITLPAGTTLALQLETTVASDSSSVEDRVRATLRQPVSLEGLQVLPAGTDVSGVVTDARRSGKVKGRARIAFRFNALTLDDEEYAIRTGVISREARGTKAKDAKTIGIPAAGGAAIGAVIGGKKGAAIGGAAGGGAGTAVVLSTRGEEVRLPAGTSVTARLGDPVTLRVPVTP